MKKADWKVLINSRERWDTQSSRTTRKTLSQSQEVELRWLQTLQLLTTLPTGPRGHLCTTPGWFMFYRDGNPWILRLSSPEIACGGQICSIWHTRLPSLLKSFEMITVTYGSYCYFLQLGPGSPWGLTSVLRSRHVTNSWEPLVLKSCSKLPSPLSPSSTH